MSQREFVDFMALAASSGGAKVLEEEPRLLVVEAKLLPGTVGAAFFLSAITGFCGRGEQV